MKEEANTPRGVGLYDLQTATAVRYTGAGSEAEAHRYFLARWIRMSQQLYRMLERAYDVYEMAQAIQDFLEFDWRDLQEIGQYYEALQAFLSAGRSAGSGGTAESRSFSVASPITGSYQKQFWNSAS